MRSTILRASSLLLPAALVLAGNAEAQCSFRPGVGTKLKVPMVRSYEACTNVNATAESGWPACSPVKPLARAHRCAEAGGDYLCSDGLDSCPRRYCDDYLSPFPDDYYSCVTNADCPAAPASSGVCSDHPGNVCVAYPDSQSLYQFGDGGSCSVSASSKVEKDCAGLKDASGSDLGLPARPCHVTTLKARCRKILAADGSTPIGPAAIGWTLTTLSRITMNDAVSYDLTQIDFPVAFEFATPDDGSIDLRVTTAEALVPLYGTVGAALPSCTVLQPVNARVLDPDGNIFAEAGLATQP